MDNIEVTVRPNEVTLRGLTRSELAEVATWLLTMLPSVTQYEVIKSDKLKDHKGDELVITGKHEKFSESYNHITLPVLDFIRENLRPGVMFVMTFSPDEPVVADSFDADQDSAVETSSADQGCLSFSHGSLGAM